MKKAYMSPSLMVIGRVAAMTGQNKNDNYLDNSNGSNAWKTTHGGQS